MKLLEERTAASKHEMDLAESLDELKELNRRWRKYSDLRIVIESVLFAERLRSTQKTL